MDDFKERLKKEEVELFTKLEKLYSFLNSDKFKELAEIQQNLLRAQYNAMNAYHQILFIRLETI